MSKADEIRATAEAQAKVAELEEQLVAAKEAGEDTTELAGELRYARWVQRGGADRDPEEDNRADAVHRERFQQEGN